MIWLSNKEKPLDEEARVLVLYMGVVFDGCYTKEKFIRKENHGFIPWGDVEAWAHFGRQSAEAQRVAAKAQQRKTTLEEALRIIQDAYGWDMRTLERDLRYLKEKKDA